MRIATFLGKLFNVRSGEWPRLSLLYCMSLAALTGLNWADAIVQAAFLQRVGVQYLPWVFVSSAVCSFIALFIYSAFADRESNTRLLIALLAVGGGGMLLGLAILAGGLSAPAYLLLYLVLNVPLMDVYNVHWATYVNGFYDIRAAKRIVPVLGTTARLAGIFAGLSMPLLNRLLSPVAIILVSTSTLAVMAILAVAMPRLLGERQIAGAARRRPRAIAGLLQPFMAARPRPPRGPGAPAGGVRSRAQELARAYRARLREGFVQIASSPFLIWMALSTLSMTVLLALLNYQASAIFQAELKTTVAISNFLGMLTGVANLVVLPIQLLALSRLIARLGLGNASLIYPVANLAAAGGLVVAPGLVTAAMAYLDRTALRTAFRLPTENLLYNAVPQHVKARTRAFVGGLLIPVGNIVGGLLLLSPLKRTAWFLPAAIVALALALLLAAVLVRRHYAHALLALLEKEDYASLALQAPSVQAPASLPAADAATLARLAEKLNESTSPERAIFMARLIAEIGGEAAVPVVGQAARTATDPRLRAALVDVLVAADVRGPEVRELYHGLLADAAGQVRLAAIGGLEQVDGPQDARFLEMAGRLLSDPEISVRLRVLPALLEANGPGYRAAGTDCLQALLDAPDPRTRGQALHVVGHTRAAGLLPAVLRSLADSVDEVRLAAALATEKLAAGTLPAGSREPLCRSVLPLLHDPIERARVAAVTILGRLSLERGRPGPGMLAELAAAPPGGAREDGDGQANSGALTGATLLAGLAASLADPSPEVRGGAVEALAAAGPQAIPQLEGQLGAADPRPRKMAAVALAQIQPRKYTPFVLGPGLHDNLAAIYRNLSCHQALAGCPGPAVSVLSRALAERNAALLHDIFYLLGTVHDPATVMTVAHALRNSQPDVRANATEALESLTAPQTAALVAPLCEPAPPPEQLLSLGRITWGLAVPAAGAALRLLLGDAADPWLRTLAAAALAELCAAAGPLSHAETVELLALARADQDPGVRSEVTAVPPGEKGAPAPAALSLVARLALLQEVSFFEGMTVDELRVLAAVCEEDRIPAGTHVFDEGDPGGALYLVVDGRVAIEQESRAGTRVRLAVVDAGSCFGEGNLFDDSPRSAAAIVLEDALVLRLCREPLIELAMRYPDISMRLVDVLAQRLREANDQIAGLARTRPRKLHRLFDSMEAVEPSF